MRRFAVLFLLACATVGLTAEPTALKPYAKPTLIAHRGASFDAPEHTLEAYALALKHAADFVEPDLQITKDGVLVCLNDTTLVQLPAVCCAMEITGCSLQPTTGEQVATSTAFPSRTTNCWQLH